MELSATEADIEELALSQAELGTIVQQTFSIRNPCDIDIVVNAISSNSRCFSLTPSCSTILPFGNAEFTLTYRPSRLGKISLIALAMHDLSRQFISFE